MLRYLCCLSKEPSSLVLPEVTVTEQVEERGNYASQCVHVELNETSLTRDYDFSSPIGWYG